MMYSHRKASQSEEGEEPRLLHWILKRWPYVFVWTGCGLFWLAGIHSSHLPLEAMFVGPVLMLAGVIMIERDKRELW